MAAKIGSLGCAWRLAVAAVLVALVAGCAQQNRGAPGPKPTPRVLVVAPVLNLSGSQDFDPLKVTDLIASEFLSFEGVSVIPVNLTLAELTRQGKNSVTTAEEAVGLAQSLGADAAIVVAVTEYNPYSPPVVGLIMQWYSARPEPRRAVFDPVTASRAVSSAERELSEPDLTKPRWQVQRVFNAADEAVLKDIRSFAAQRDGRQSPYGWQQYTKSQELYVRYCGWALIRTMLRLDESSRNVEPHEAHS